MSKPGYKRPPKHTQFKKGQSGNPKGRPRKIDQEKDLLTIISKVLNEDINVSEGGVHKSIPIKEAIVRKMAIKALSGDIKAQQELIKLWEKHVKPEEIRREKQREKARLSKEEPATAEEAARAYAEAIKDL